MGEAAIAKQYMLIPHPLDLPVVWRFHRLEQLITKI
jgi:hypothetical protein